MSKAKQAGIEYEESSGNVFADLGLEDADELSRGRSWVFMSTNS